MPRLSPATLTESWQHIADLVSALASDTYLASQAVWIHADEPGFEDRLSDSGIAELDAILTRIASDLNVLAGPAPEAPRWVVDLQDGVKNPRTPDLHVLREVV